MKLSDSARVFFVAVVELDVVGSRRIRVKPNACGDGESNCFRLGLPYCFRRLPSAFAFVQPFVCELVHEYRELLGCG